MERLCALGLIVVFSSVAVAQRTCDVAGNDLQHAVRVRDADGRRFTVSVRASTWFAQLRRRSAHVDVRGYLEFEGEVHIDDLGLALRRATTLSPLLHIGSRSDATIKGAYAREDHVRARLHAGPFVFDGVELACADLVLDDERQRAAYEAGFHGYSHRASPDVEHCAAHPEVYAQLDAYGQGQADRTAHEQRGAEDRDREVGYWEEFELRPFELSSSAYGGDSLRVAAARSNWTAHRFGPQVGASRSWSVSTLILEEERRHDRMRVRVAWGASFVEGWISPSMVFSVRSLLGSLGSIGHSGGGNSGVGFSSPYRLAPEAVVRMGAPVFASPRASMPWARIGGSQSVRVAVHGEWTKIVDAKSIEAERDVMWVRTIDVTQNEWSEGGLRVALRSSERPFRQEIKVLGVEPSSVVEEMGFEVGDIVLSDVGVNIPLWISRFARVRRGGELLVLRDPCREEYQRWRDAVREEIRVVLDPTPTPDDLWLD